MESKLIKYVAVITLALTVFRCGAAKKESNISEAHLKDFFESITIVGGNWMFTFSKTGERCVYSINDGETQVSNPGETKTVPRHSKFCVFDRHLTLTFSPLLGKEGDDIALLSFIADFRSMRGGISTNLAHLVVSTGESKTQMTSCVSVEGKSCLVGLKLVPVQTAK